MACAAQIAGQVSAYIGIAAVGVEGGVKCSCSGFGAVLDDERKVAGKRNYFTAVVVVVM